MGYNEWGDLPEHSNHDEWRNVPKDSKITHIHEHKIKWNDQESLDKIKKSRININNILSYHKIDDSTRKLLEESSKLQLEIMKKLRG